MSERKYAYDRVSLVVASCFNFYRASIHILQKRTSFLYRLCVCSFCYCIFEIAVLLLRIRRYLFEFCVFGAVVHIWHRRKKHRRVFESCERQILGDIPGVLVVFVYSLSCVDCECVAFFY